MAHEIIGSPSYKAGEVLRMEFEVAICKLDCIVIRNWIAPVLKMFPYQAMEAAETVQRKNFRRLWSRRRSRP
eukprot:6118548-Alexandrium_andersonii.AAC.1